MEMNLLQSPEVQKYMEANRGHLWKRRVCAVRLWDLRLNQPGLALTKRGKLEANRRRRRKGDLILPIADAASEQLGLYPG